MVFSECRSLPEWGGRLADTLEKDFNYTHELQSIPDCDPLRRDRSLGLVWEAGREERKGGRVRGLSPLSGVVEWCRRRD